MGNQIADPKKGIDLENISTGLTGQATLIVGTNDTAPKVGSGVIPVLATPVMINLIEEAALDACEALLPEGKQSLGTLLNVSHVAPTPIGMKVVATAELVEIDGRTLVFKVAVKDETDLIGEGFHNRVIVTEDRFMERVAAKAR